MAHKTKNVHVHDDMEVTRTRLDAFANASRMEQAEVLAILRARAADESSAATLGLLSILIATLVVMIGPVITINVDDSLRTNPIFVAALVAVIVIVLLLAFTPALFDQARYQNRRERAAVWIGAYQDELARRHRLKGRVARRWQRRH